MHWQIASDLSGTKTNLPVKVQQFLTENDKWLREQVRLNPAIAYWNQVAFVLTQSDGNLKLLFLIATGMFAGYNEYAPVDERISYIDWLSFQAAPEMGDIFTATGSSSDSIPKYYFGTHCSGMTFTAWVLILQPSLSSQRITFLLLTPLGRALRPC